MYNSCNKTFDRDLDNSFHLFVNENIWIDDNNSKLNIPYFIREYLFDLDDDENTIIDILLQELYKDPFMYKEYRKTQCRILAGKIVVRYYKEYDRPQRNVWLQFWLFINLNLILSIVIFLV